METLCCLCSKRCRVLRTNSIHKALTKLNILSIDSMIILKCTAIASKICNVAVCVDIFYSIFKKCCCFFSNRRGNWGGNMGPGTQGTQSLAWSPGWGQSLAGGPRGWGHQGTRPSSKLTSHSSMQEH